MANVYLNLDLKEFEKQKKKAIETAEKDGSDGFATWTDLKWNIDTGSTEIESDGKILMSGDIGNLGYLSIGFSLGLEDMADLIEVYIKKLNRLKTVLEATSK